MRLQNSTTNNYFLSSEKIIKINYLENEYVYKLIYKCYKVFHNFLEISSMKIKKKNYFHPKVTYNAFTEIVSYHIVIKRTLHA